MSLSVCHLLNDMNQSLVPALYPILKDSYRLDFGQIGLITLAFQLTASMLQPVVGMVTDRRPQPYSLPIAMGCSLVGLLLLAVADNYPTILLAAALVGVGSSVFHPESSRVARMASGGRHGFAQSLFQVGGSTGSAIGPLLAAFIVVPRGQGSVAWFSGRRAAGDPAADQCRPVVQPASVATADPRRQRPELRLCRAVTQEGAVRDRHPGRAAVLQERLHLVARLVLHVLPDP